MTTEQRDALRDYLDTFESFGDSPTFPVGAVIGDAIVLFAVMGVVHDVPNLRRTERLSNAVAAWREGKIAVVDLSQIDAIDVVHAVRSAVSGSFAHRSPGGAVDVKMDPLPIGSGAIFVCTPEAWEEFGIEAMANSVCRL